MQSNTPLEEFVSNMLRNELPSHYFYHDLGHTLYVTMKCNEIGKAEHCSKHELHMLHAAALLHDTGYIHKYNHHEEESCKIARKLLPGFGYSVDEIKLICEMIMATKIPQTPKNKLGEIIADADLEYLATPHAEFLANNLYKELHHRHPSLTPEKWDLKQITFMQNHKYFTTYCKEHKTHEKQKYLDKLLARVVF